MRAGADFALTQLFFDAREYEDLVSHLRGQGITTPVIPGILPIQSFDSLRRVPFVRGQYSAQALPCP